MLVQGGYSFENIFAHGKRASQRFLQRAGAFIRACARRNLKNRKHKTSEAGNPPFVHSGIFKASVLFDVDPMAQRLYVGPQALGTQRKNSKGQGVPEILEYGGRPARGVVANWWHKKAPFMTNESQLVAYVQRIGRGPFVWGKTKAEAEAKMEKVRKRREGKKLEKAKGGKRSQYVNYQRYSPKKGRKVYIQNIRVKTPKQAKMVADTVVELFGMPYGNPFITISARPLMAYTMSQPNVASTLARIQQEEFSNYTK